MFELRRLQLLYELRQRGTIAAVARALSFSPSSVSEQLAQLQREAGVPLLEHVGRLVRLTEAGELLARHAERMLSDAEQAEADLAALAGKPAGAVTVTAFQTAILHLIAPILPVLAARYPELRVQVIAEEAEAALQNLSSRQADLVITNEYEGLPLPRDPALLEHLLLTEPVHVVLPAAQPLAAPGRTLSLRDLAAEPWAAGQQGTPHAEMTLRACQKFGGFVPEIRHRADDPLVLLALIGSGQAVALLPDLVHPQADPAVSVHRIAECGLHRTTSVWMRKEGSVSPPIRAVWQALCTAAA